VITSPIRTGWLAARTRLPLSRTCPDTAKAAASLRVRTMRACHSHLSIRWRSGAEDGKASVWLLLLELLLQRGKLGEWRIRVRLLVAPVGAMGTGVILRALGATRAFVAATARRTRSAVRALAAVRARVLLLVHALTALVPVAAVLAGLPIALGAATALGLSAGIRCRSGLASFGRRFGLCGLLRALMMRSTMMLRLGTPLGSSGRTPHLDHLWFGGFCRLG